MIIFLWRWSDLYDYFLAENRNMFSVNFHSTASHHKEIEKKTYLSIANSTNSEQADDRASEPVPRYAGLLESTLESRFMRQAAWLCWQRWLAHG